MAAGMNWKANSQHLWCCKSECKHKELPFRVTLSSILFLMQTRKIPLALHLSDEMQDHPFSCPLCWRATNLELQKPVEYWHALRWGGKLNVVGFHSSAMRFIVEASFPQGPSEIVLEMYFWKGISQTWMYSWTEQAGNACLHVSYLDLSLACLPASSWCPRAPDFAGERRECDALTQIQVG